MDVVLVAGGVLIACMLAYYLHRASLREGAKMRETHATVVERRAEEDRAREMEHAARKGELAQRIDAVIDGHVRTLARKRTQMLRTDDYGNRLADGVEEWREAREYFFEHVVQRDIDDAAIQPGYALRRIDERVVQHIEAEGDPGLYGSPSGMSGVEYEQYCALLLERCGWSVRLTRGSGDQGVDILAERESRRVVIQCKNYSSPVGNKAVQEVVAAKGFEKADYSAVVSNASYTPAAKELATANNVLLLHHSELSELWGSIAASRTES